MKQHARKFDAITAAAVPVLEVGAMVRRGASLAVNRYRTRRPSRTQTSSSRPTVVSVKKFHRT